MTDNLLAKAIAGLNIHDVVLTEQHALISANYDQVFPDSLQLDVNIISGVAQEIGTKTLTMVSGDIKNYLVYRLRGQVKMFPKPQAKDDIGDEIEAYADVTAIFSAYYEVMSDEPIEKEALAIFGYKNVPFHVWPYFRHYVTSTLLQLRLPMVTLPFYQVPVQDKHSPKDD